MLSFFQSFQPCLSQNSTVNLSESPRKINIQFSVWLHNQQDKYIVIINCSSSKPLNDCATDFFSRYSISHLGFQEKLIHQLNHRMDLLHQNLTASITVAIPTWRRWDFLQKSLPIYLNRPEVAEVIICDETGDDVREIMNSKIFADYGSKLRLVINSQRLGAYHNKRKALSLAKTKWVALLDSDNLFLDDWFDNLYQLDFNANNMIYASAEFEKLDLHTQKSSQPCLKYNGYKISTQNWNAIFEQWDSDSLLNDGNWILPSSAYAFLPEVLDGGELHASDAIFILWCLIKNGYTIDYQPGLRYQHISHNGSYWLQTATESLNALFQRNWISANSEVKTILQSATSPSETSSSIVAFNDLEVVGTDKFLDVIEKFCIVHNIKAVKDFIEKVEKYAYVESQLNIQKAKWTADDDISYLVKAYGGYEVLRVFVGQFSYGWKGLTIRWWGRVNGANAGLRIGRYVQIAGDVVIYLGGGHCYKRVAMYPFDDLNYHFQNSSGVYHSSIFRNELCSVQYCKGPIIIGNDVWIGGSVVIMSGVTVGDGAILGANAVVRENVPPYAIVTGNPSRITGFRHKPDQVEKLLAIKWWDWPKDKVLSNLDLLMSMDIDTFINAHFSHRE